MKCPNLISLIMAFDNVTFVTPINPHVIASIRLPDGWTASLWEPTLQPPVLTVSHSQANLTQHFKMSRTLSRITGYEAGFMLHAPGQWNNYRLYVSTHPTQASTMHSNAITPKLP